MITIGFSTKYDNPKFIEYLKETCGIKEPQIIQKTNNGQYSLTQVYNQIIEESVNDIIVFCHDDILFEKNYWGKRIVEHFEKNGEYGIIGVAGTKYFPESGRWWEIQSEMVGQVYHQHEGKKWLSEYNKSFGNGIIQTVLVDGLFFGIHKKRIKNKFDETYDGFHFYDVSFCMSNFFKNVKIGTISNIPITHLSIGMTNQKWEDSRVKFVKSNLEKLPAIVHTDYPVNKINNSQPLVSIIIPIHNYGVMFEKTLQSVFESSYKNYEIVIICDGSENKYVLTKLKTLENHPNIKVIYQENGGPSKARNVGIENSTGEYILPLDSDDFIKNDYIQKCVNIIKKDKKISPVYCDTIHVGQLQGVEKRPEWSMDRLLQGPFIVNCSMFSKDSFNKCGGYDENLKGWEDYDLWIRMGLNGYVGKKIQEPLFYYFHHENDGTVSTEANKNPQELYNKIMIKNKLLVNELK